jgi:hypothetical protein
MCPSGTNRPTITSRAMSRASSRANRTIPKEGRKVHANRATRAATSRTMGRRLSSDAGLSALMSKSRHRQSAAQAAARAGKPARRIHRYELRDLRGMGSKPGGPMTRPRAWRVALGGRTSEPAFRYRSRQVRWHQPAGKRLAGKWHLPNLRGRTCRNDASTVYSTW